MLVSLSGPSAKDVFVHDPPVFVTRGREGWMHAKRQAFITQRPSLDTSAPPQVNNGPGKEGGGGAGGLGEVDTCMDADAHTLNRRAAADPTPIFTQA